MTEVIKSRLVFVDTDSSALDGTTNDFSISFPAGVFRAQDGQFLRITLQDFNMVKTFYNVNPTNNQIAVSNKKTRTDSVNDFNTIYIEDSDYATRGNIATTFTTALVSYLNTSSVYNPNSASGDKWRANVSTGIKPSENDQFGKSVYSVKLELTNASGAVIAHNLTNDNDLAIQCRDYNNANGISVDCNDSYQLLGVKRINVANQNAKSFVIDSTSDANAVTIDGYYPLQRFTTEHLYLRLPDISGNNYQTSHFDRHNSYHTLYLTPSPIFAKMPIQDEIVSYTDTQSIGSGYFMDISDESLTKLRFKLTDSRGRPVPTIDANQSTLGNYNFTMCLRFDVIQYGPNQRQMIGPPPKQNFSTDGLYRTDVRQGQRS